MDKKCRTCKLELPVASFSKKTSEADGLRRDCRDCAKVYRAAYYKDNRDKLIKYAADYQVKNPDAAYRWQKKAQSNGREKYNAQKAKYYHDRKVEINSALKERYTCDAEFRADKLARSAESRLRADPEAIWSYMAEYRRANRKRLNVLSANYRAKKSGANGKITHDDWLDILRYHCHRCAYCLRHETEVGTLAQEHMMPLVRGGSHNVENIAPSCRPCNSSKNDSTPLEFLARLCGTLTIRPARASINSI